MSCARIGCCAWFGAVVFFFFFQAEDGIRDLTVTGVQTCALPIFRRRKSGSPACKPWLRTWRANDVGTPPAFRRDRKSTRLNSSHSQISYAVFCLKKKKTSLIYTYTVTDCYTTNNSPSQCTNISQL